MSFTLSSPAFENGKKIPPRYTCDGENVSPPLKWANAPQETQSFALIVEDPDAPGGTYRHWGIYNISGQADHLGEAFPADGNYRQAHNDFGDPGYGGPCPPRNHGPHHYHFRLYALDVPKLNLADHTRIDAVMKAIQPHVLDGTEITGIYER